MATLAEIYTADDMPPAATVGQNVSIWTNGKWDHFRVVWLEQMPYGGAFVRDFGALAANTWGNSTLVTQLQLDENELLQVRFRPIDDFEIRTWEMRSTGRFVVKNVHATVSLFTAGMDPHWKSSTVWVLGKERDLYMELYNPTDYALTQSRVHFWGYRFSVERLSSEPAISVYFPAEGRK